MSEKYNLILVLLLGILLGFGFSYFLISFSTPFTIHIREPVANFNESTSRASLPSKCLNVKNFTNVHNLSGGVSLEEKKVKVLCWVLTSPQSHIERAIHIHRTWGRRCDKLLFMSTQEDPRLPGTVALKTTEGRDYLWGKTKEAFKFVYQYYSTEADWILKADDDTYLIMENLRYFLKDYDSNSPLYFGCRFRPHVQQGYMSGGAGYVLSKAALKKFVEDAIPNRFICKEGDEGEEDVELGICLQNVGVVAGDSRDSFGKHRFLPFLPEHHIIPGMIKENDWYWKYSYYPQSQGYDCCSDTTISFHYTTPYQMYVLEFLLYRMRPHGLLSKDYEGNSNSLQFPIPFLPVQWERDSRMGLRM